MKITQNHSGSGDNVGRDKIVNFQIPTIWIILAFFLLVVFLLKNNCNRIGNFLGQDKVFQVTDSRFKILILPFKLMCEGKPSKDIGLEIKDRLEELNRTDSLNIYPYYLDVDISKNFNSDSAEWLQIYHNADQIIFGNYYDDNCTNGNGDEICYNWITDKKWNLEELARNELTSSNYQSVTMNDIRKGKVQVKTDLIIYLIAGTLEYTQNKIRKSIERFDKIIALDPNFSEAYQTKGLLLASLGKYEESTNILNKLLDITAPTNAASYYNIGINLCRLGKFEKAIIQFDQALFYEKNIDNEIDCYIYKGVSFALLNKLSESNDQLNKAIELSSDKLSTYSRIGIVFGNYGLFDDAIKYFDQITNDYSCGSWLFQSAYFNKGSTLIKLGRYEDAILCFNLGVSINPFDSQSYFGKGFALASQGRWEDAVHSIDKAIDINPNDFDYYFRKGVALYALEKYLSAIDQFEHSIVLNPEFADAYYLKGIALGKSDKYEDALIYFDKTIAINPGYSDAYYHKGLTLAILEKYEQSISYFDQAISMKSDQVDYYFGKSNALLYLKRYDEALKWAEIGLKYDPYDNDLIELRGAILEINMPAYF